MSEGGNTSRWKTITIVVVLLLAVLVAIAEVSLWLGRHALESDRFVLATEEVLGTRESRQVLAGYAVTAVVDELPLLSVFETAAVEVLAVALDSSALDGIRKAAAEDIHERIITGDDSAVFVSLSPVREVVLEPISAIAPSAIELIPDELLDGIEVIEAGALPSLRTAAAVSPWLAIVAIFFAAGLAATLIVVSPRRPLALAAVGVGIALGGLLGVAAAPIGRSVARGWATTEFAEVLTVGIYDRLVGALLTGSIVLLAVGALVAAGGFVWSLATSSKTQSGD